MKAKAGRAGSKVALPKVDPLTLAVVGGALEQIAEEMAVRRINP